MPPTLKTLDIGGMYRYGSAAVPALLTRPLPWESGA